MADMQIPNIRKELEAIAGEMCDHYCKWPDQYFDPSGIEEEQTERLVAERCKTCPILQFLTG